MNTTNPPSTLAARICRPQRIGIFGHRGVGKTTLLTMLYREAVGGRLPGLRLAAADARTADYLSEKILQLESGNALPGTLAETELRFHLYQDDARFQLLIKDYQGEHVEIGREEPIREFFRDCDAVWLCVDATSLFHPQQRLQRQMEIEQLIEDLLALEPDVLMNRPVALVLTKSDLLETNGMNPSEVDKLVAERLNMILHALQTHCSNSGWFMVSSLRKTEESASPAVIHLQPNGLLEPLGWLTHALRTQDEARMEQVFQTEHAQTTPMGPCLQAFKSRYPKSGNIETYQSRIRELRRSRIRKRGLLTAACLACMFGLLWTYDAVGHQRALTRQQENAQSPAKALRHWREYQTWHPTRTWFLPVSYLTEEKDAVETLTSVAKREDARERLASLQRQVSIPETDPETLWRNFCDFQTDHADCDAAELSALQTAVESRRAEHEKNRLERAFSDLAEGEQRKSDLESLLVRANRFLRDFPGSSREGEVRRRRDAYLQRLDERDIGVARAYSARQPLNFQTRLDHYQRYLDQHAGAGAFAQEARTAIETIARDWDKHDFRVVRDQYVSSPEKIQDLTARCRAYLAAHPKGKFVSQAVELLRWGERVTAIGEYRVVLKEGDFEKRIARFFSRGPDLSVVIEVNGIRHGPSNITVNRYCPEWDYEFPRRIRWKMGDSVVIRVTDHDWKDRVVLTIRSEDGDPFAMKMLSGEVSKDGNSLTFESDFTMPKLPAIE